MYGATTGTGHQEEGTSTVLPLIAIILIIRDMDSFDTVRRRLSMWFSPDTENGPYLHEGNLILFSHQIPGYSWQDGQKYAYLPATMTRSTGSPQQGHRVPGERRGMIQVFG